jgi:predicted LPLAT superfamily acyltransferase
MLQVMAWISLRLGRPAARVVLRLIAAYFLVMAASARRASRGYLRRVLERDPGWAELYRHFFWFASTVHDRVYLLNDRFDLFDIEVHGESLVAEALSSGRGALLFGAHLGSFEATRAVGRRQPSLRVAMVMYEENAAKINARLAALAPSCPPDIIPLGRVDSMLQVSRRLDAGDFVGILADRGLGGEESRVLDLLGSPSTLPVGPFRMAAFMERPVIFMTGLYRGGNRYAIHFEPLADFSTVPRDGRQAAIQAAMTRYAWLLEQHCRREPYNWFNFFDFWAPYGEGV